MLNMLEKCLYDLNKYNFLDTIDGPFIFSIQCSNIFGLAALSKYRKCCILGDYCVSQIYICQK